MSNIDATLKERGSRYGEFDEHARVTQNIKSMMADSKNWQILDDDMRECLEMVAHKVGRILNGDPHYIDSWTDITGYTRLVEKRLVAEQATVKSMLVGDSTDATTFGPVAASAAAQGWRESAKNTVSLKDALGDIKITATDPRNQATADVLGRVLGSAGFKAFTAAEVDELFNKQRGLNGNT